ncbi:MAG: LytTR family DNA-binding domain-containing protein [Flavobacteriaceae bacterium]|nr:LytTR family DNA-binding domain-containing protein [Flavobacteriaceae bacterium]
MIKAIIVDDEFNAIKNLKWELENFCEDIEVCDSFTNPVEAISAINYLKPDCVFLDIEMPEMDGFQLLSKLAYRDFDLIITTAFDNYAIRAFKENAVDYLLKPIDSDDLVKSVSKIKANKNKNELGFEFNKILESITPKTKKAKISLPLSGKIIFVNAEDILYCKSDGNYTEIFFKTHKKEMLSKKLKEVEALIHCGNFFRVHNSYLVNLDYITEFVKSDGQYLVLEDVDTCISFKKKCFVRIIK